MTLTHSESALAADQADQEAYQRISDTISKIFADHMEETLKRLQSSETLHEVVTEAFAANGEAAPALEESEALFRGFWRYARGLETSFRWRNVTGLPEIGYFDARTVAPPPPPAEVASAGEHPEFSIGVSAFGFGLGVSF
jgi:hypothetical protein